MSLNEIEEVKSRIDLTDLIGQYVVLRKAGANYKCVCPFHQEKTPSMMVSPQKQIWKCFGCGRGGDHFKFIMEAEHLEFGDALRLLAQRAGVTLQPRTQAEHQTRDKKETLYAINNLSARVFQKILLEQPAAKAALTYLQKRGISDEIIKQFGIGFVPRRFSLRDFLMKRGFTAADIVKAGSPDKFFDRIMFPIQDVLGHTIAFTGRVLGDAQPKYLNSPDNPLFSKSRTIYGLNFAKAGIKERDYVVLVEGQMDVIALHQAGATQAVASSGTAITDAQLLILSKYTNNFLLAFDGDNAGKATTKKVIEALLRFDLNVKVVDFGTYKDAGELLEKEPKAWPAIVKAAREGMEWWIAEEVSVAGDTQFIENKKKIVKAMLPILLLIQEPTRLDHYVQRLALAIGIKNEAVYAALEKAGAANQAKPSASPQKTAPVHLTNEEQLLAAVIARPDLAATMAKKFEQVVWQSEQASLIAQEVKKQYTDKTLTKTPSKFLSQVKTNLDSQVGEKIDSWQFWLSSQWGEMSDELATELLTEKLGQLATIDYERRKETLAQDIRRAQEKGDINQVKQLMQELSKLAKER
jgi:DNA primase